VIEFGGWAPWGKLDHQEREQVNWHRVHVRGLPPLERCSGCFGGGDGYCETCRGTELMPCSARACPNREAPDTSKDCMCDGTGKERCVKCPRCARCCGDGAVPVALREAC
jgi:hypothetical protein